MQRFSTESLIKKWVICEFLEATVTKYREEIIIGLILSPFFVCQCVRLELWQQAEFSSPQCTNKILYENI